MAANKLTEGTVTLILNHIKTNIASALAAVRTAAPDDSVTTEPPRTYFTYPKAKGYRSPAVFVIAEDFDFRAAEMGANFISGSLRINVSVLLEDRNRDLLTTRCWRYQSALYALLAQTQLTTSDNALKIISIVKRARYSPLYSSARNEEAPEAIFRKEVLLECDVDHYENFV